MNIAPSDEFLRACRLVLGADDPATVLAVMRTTDHELIAKLLAAHAELVDAGPTVGGQDAR
jgi:hypothetical protein